MARTPPPVDSTALLGAVSLRGVATARLDEPIGAVAGSTQPALMRRVFDFQATRVLHGTADPKVRFEFEGYSALAPAQRVPAAFQSIPALDLEGQALFDWALPEGPLDVVLVVGGPPLPSRFGLQGKTSRALAGPYAGQPVRALWLHGADRALVDALPALPGWHDPVSWTPTTHVLPALDALRLVIAGKGPFAWLPALAREVLGPWQPASVIVAALPLLVQALSRGAPSSPEAQQALDAITDGLRAGRADLGAAYREALAALAPQVDASARRVEIRGLLGAATRRRR